MSRRLELHKIPGMSGDIDVNQLSNVMTRLGEAVVDPAAWTGIMTSICEAVGATAAVLLQADVRTPDVPRTAAIDEAVQLYFAQNWHLQDPRARGVPRAMSGEIITDQQLLTPEELRSDPMYNEVLYRYGFKWFAGIGFWADTAPWVLTLQRTGQEGLFETRETRLLAQLAPRLSETATLSTVVGRSALAGITNALDLIQVAAIAVSRFGVIIGMNNQAQACLGHDLTIRNNRLTLRDRHANVELARLIDQVCGTSDLLTIPSAPIIMRRIDKRPIVIQLQPVPPAARSPFLGARAILLIRDLEGSVTFDQNLLAATFELTPAQARLAAKLARGDSLEDAAEDIGVAVATARNQLKAIFQKTGTHRQAELVALFHKVR